MQSLTPPVLSGAPHDIGHALGVLARPVMDDYMGQRGAWRALRPWRGHSFVKQLWQAALAAYPEYVAELKGIAAGLGWPVDDVFLWNCRGELIHNVPDGCTTLAVRARETRYIAHNEDGDPYLRDHAMLVDIRPTGKPGFISFYYPGSLPGHTFAVNRAGLVQTINNLRIVQPQAGVPRMVLARAVLDVRSIGAAHSVLAGNARASGFHHTLGCVGDERLLSIEATVLRCSVAPIELRSGHANHMTHSGSDQERQIVTASSLDRQNRVDRLLPALGEVNGANLLDVLFDKAPAGLPIYRDDPADPDDENTLASAVFTIGPTGVAFEVHRLRERCFENFITKDTQPRAVS
ncbi:C45 family peptidase [Bordetella sp. FB-8]|uniref:C45 family autoproteolytic acyltransferase/hydolase n=1 Tax=Bordetella sp. FB-8 TaxID=1159870 RepID=UPI0003769D57|nr:C45 family peptidase [Bordetella sp. FB-8]